MPLCKKPGCFIVSRDDYCDKHRPNLDQYKRSQDYIYLYKTPKWKRIREAYKKDNPLCVRCLSNSIWNNRDINVDHVQPHRGNQDLFYNGVLQSLCRSCHSYKTQEEQRGRIHHWIIISSDTVRHTVTDIEIDNQ